MFAEKNVWTTSKIAFTEKHKIARGDGKIADTFNAFINIFKPLNTVHNESIIRDGSDEKNHVLRETKNTKNTAAY